LEHSRRLRYSSS